MRVKIHRIIKQTAGGFHSWCESNVGRIRKPNSSIAMMMEEEKERRPLREFLVEPKWYQKLWRWLVKLFKR